MPDVDQLLTQYIAEHRAGGDANPRAYLDQLAGADRAELEALIVAYLERSPGQRWDPEGYAGSPAERLVESLQESLAGASGSWPVLLPELRHHARIKREQLVERLAAALGVVGREQKVAYYYNQMEHGRLPPAGVSDRVLDALAGIVGTTKETLRRTGEAVGPPGAEGNVVYARVAPPPQPEYADESGMARPGDAGTAASDRAEPDEVDELFLGG